MDSEKLVATTRIKDEDVAALLAAPKRSRKKKVAEPEPYWLARVTHAGKQHYILGVAPKDREIDTTPVKYHRPPVRSRLATPGHPRGLPVVTRAGKQILQRPAGPHLTNRQVRRHAPQTGIIAMRRLFRHMSPEAKMAFQTLVDGKAA